MLSLLIFQVALTGYELIAGSMAEWPVTLLVANEFNNILLVFYSACNPLAYCGELIYKKLCLDCLCCCKDGLETASAAAEDGAMCPRGGGIFRSRRGRGQLRGFRRGRDESEYNAMKSIGITLGGPDPIMQQLNVSQVRSGQCLAVGHTATDKL